MDIVVKQCIKIPFDQICSIWVCGKWVCKLWMSNEKSKNFDKKKKQPKSEQPKSEQPKSEQPKSEKPKFPKITWAPWWFEPYIVWCMVVENHLYVSRGKMCEQDVWMQVWKCFICLILVKFVFFIHFKAVVYDQSVKKRNVWFYMFSWPKEQYGQLGELRHGCINGFLAQKWLISAEGKRKCDNCLG